MEELRLWYEANAKHNNKVHQAKERCAGGIVEALEKLSLGPHLSPRDRMNSNGIQVSENAQPAHSGRAQREVVEFNTFFEKWMNGEVPSDSETFQRLTSVIVSSFFLTACFFKIIVSLRVTNRLGDLGANPSFVSLRLLNAVGPSNVGT